MDHYELGIDHDPEIERLRADIVERRSVGDVLFAVKSASIHGLVNHRDIADSLVSAMGCTGLGRNWLEIDQQEAVWVITRVLWGDVCYNAAVMTRDEALDLAMRFRRLFGEASFFTNGTWRKRMVPLPDPIDYLDGFWPITQATCDTGVVVVGSARVGMLWVMDED